MEITKKTTITITIDDECPKRCNKDCIYFINKPNLKAYKCRRYNCKLESVGFRCEECITDFGVGDESI